MEDKILFSDRRWTDIPQATVISHRELTDEEKNLANEYRKRISEKFNKNKK